MLLSSILRMLHKLRYESVFTIVLVLLFYTPKSLAQFKFRVVGTVEGIKKGTLTFVESLSQQSYVVIPFDDGYFTYQGEAADLKFYNIALLEDVEKRAISIAPFILEAGNTDIRILIDTTLSPASVDVHFREKGNMNSLLLKYTSLEKHFKLKHDEASKRWWFKAWYLENISQLRSDSLNLLLSGNRDNVLGLYLVYTQRTHFPDHRIRSVLASQPSSLKNTVYYKMCWSKLNGKDNNGVGEILSDFCLPDRGGKQVCLSALTSQNDYVLLEFWGSWCGPCREETRQLIPVYQEYKKNGFEVLSIALEHSKENWIKAITTDGHEWPTVVELENDIKGDLCISKFLNPEGRIPFSILLDRKGRVVAKEFNPMELNAFLLKNLEPKR